MAANDPQQTTLISRQGGCLTASELAIRLDEEVSRAQRYGTQLSCLLVCLEEMARLRRAHGEELPAQALAYLCAALERQLRRFDRVGFAGTGELLIVLPGADERRGEIVARRALGRLRSIKVETAGQRESLRISVGIAGWRTGLSATQLLAQTRTAARRGRPFRMVDVDSSLEPRLTGEDATQAPQRPA